MIAPYAASQPPVEKTEPEMNPAGLLLGLWRYLPWLLGVALLVAAATYLWARQQPVTYEASTTLITVSGTNNFDGNIISAPPLPRGALAEALQGPLVLGEVIRRVRADSRLAPELRQDLAGGLERQLRSQRLTQLQLTSSLDPNGAGLYSVTAQAPTSASAAILADLTSQALLNWDVGRALKGVQRAETSLRAQLEEIDRQLRAGSLSDLERQTLVAARASAQRNLAQASIQAEAITGSLDLVSPAVEPLLPIAPRPLRSAALAGLLSLFLGAGIVAFLLAQDRTVRSEEELMALGLPILGVLPRLRRRDVVLSGIVRASRQAGLYEAVGFLRVNLMTALRGRNFQTLMVTSTAPGEGKSSVTAALADAFASSGQRVLIIDADLRRGTQEEVWEKYERERTWRQLLGTGGGRTLQAALQDPHNVQVMQTEPNVDLLPAGPGLRDTLAQIDRPDFRELLLLWGKEYDLVLVDSPPLLALADGLVLGRHVDAVLMVAEEGRTSMQAIRRALRRADGAGVKLLGFVLNKVNFNNAGQNSYGYSYNTRQ